MAKNERPNNDLSHWQILLTPPLQVLQSFLHLPIPAEMVEQVGICALIRRRSGLIHLRNQSIVINREILEGVGKNHVVEKGGSKRN